MKKFVVKFSYLLITLIGVMIIISFLLEMLIEKNNKEKQYIFHANWHTIVNQNYDKLFIGNSRVWVQINAELISLKTNSKVYNLTQDGRGANILWYKFKNYLKYNTPPKEIFLQFDNKFISNIYKNTFYSQENYLTYIYHDPLKLNKLFQEEYGFSDYETYIPLIRYFRYKEILYSHLTGHQNYDWHNIKTYKYGFDAMDLTWNANNSWKSIWNNPSTKQYNTNNLKYIDSFRIYCNANNIKLHLFHPPQSYTSFKKTGQNSRKILSQYILKYNLEFQDFNSNIYNDSTLFYNHTHLNRKGSKIFTDQIINHYFK